MTDRETHRLLILTLGGTPEPIAMSIRNWRPRSIRFVASQASANQIENSGTSRSGEPLPSLKEVLRTADYADFDPGRYDVLTLRDHEDFEKCVGDIQKLNPEVEKWLDRGEDFEIVVDITGGTKCMSAALALHARQWKCTFSYIGGAERTKGGLGIVKTGSERPTSTANPWELLGYQSMEQFQALFNQGAFGPAKRLAEEVGKKVRGETQEQFNSLRMLALAYEQWDRFEHGSARGNMEYVLKHLGQLSLCLSGLEQGGVERHREHLASIAETTSSKKDAAAGRIAQSPLLVLDLVANARRRMNEGRYDDAVARLYRAIEANAQVVLLESHKIDDTSRIPLEKVPEPLRGEWTPRAPEGTLMLGLQEDYRLLAALGDPLGRRFQDSTLSYSPSDREKNKRNPLNGRNQSILAHGFTPLGEGDCKNLFKAVCDLCEIDGEALDSLAFPTVGPPKR